MAVEGCDDDVLNVVAVNVDQGRWGQHSFRLIGVYRNSLCGEIKKQSRLIIRLLISILNRSLFFFFFFFEGIPLPYFYPYPSPSPFGAATYFLGRTLMLSQPPFRHTLFKQLLLD